MHWAVQVPTKEGGGISRSPTRAIVLLDRDVFSFLLCSGYIACTCFPPSPKQNALHVRWPSLLSPPHCFANIAIIAILSEIDPILSRVEGGFIARLIYYFIFPLALPLLPRWLGGFSGVERGVAKIPRSLVHMRGEKSQPKRSL